MKKDYFQIYTLLDQLNDPLPRLQKIQEIIQKPSFQYKKKEGADLIMSLFLRSSYWLDKELFNECYLFSKENQNLSQMERIHLTMVDIGVSLLNKGFPLRYNPTEYTAIGPHQLGTYVRVFVDQCHRKHSLLHQKIAHQHPLRPIPNLQKGYES